MTTTKKKSDASMIKVHPAVAALRRATQVFLDALKMSREFGSTLVTGDLEHDERAIAISDQPFVWMLWASGTHMSGVGTGAQCLIGLRWREDGCELVDRSKVERLRGCAAIAGEEAELYVWDGAALQRASSVDHMVELYVSAYLSTALAECERKLSGMETGSSFLGEYERQARLIRAELAR